MLNNLQLLTETNIQCQLTSFSLLENGSGIKLQCLNKAVVES